MRRKDKAEESLTFRGNMGQEIESSFFTEAELAHFKRQLLEETVDFPAFTRHFLAWKNSLLQISLEKCLQYDYAV